MVVDVPSEVYVNDINDIVVVVVGHHIQQIDLQPCLWSAEQGKNDFTLSPFAP